MPNNLDPFAHYDAIFARSSARLPLSSRADVTAAFSHRWPGGLEESQIYERLKTLLLANAGTFDTHAVRSIARGLIFRTEIEGRPGPDRELVAILRGFGGGTKLKEITDPAWDEVADLGRALVAMGVHLNWPNAQTAIVLQSIRRIKSLGFKVEATPDGIDFPVGELESITAQISSHLSQLGIYDALNRIFGHLREVGDYGEGLYLPGPQPCMHRTKASVPFGFLTNLAVRAQQANSDSSHSEQEWQSARELARDVVACLEVEPSSQFFAINVAPYRLPPFLQRLGLFDHLFGLRQWPANITPLVLREFFSSVDAEIRNSAGFDVDDVVHLIECVESLSSRDPAVFSRSSLLGPNLSQAKLDLMLPYFVHSTGSLNSDYDAPTAAQKANLLFKPLVAVGKDHLLQPAASLSGPAYYEALAAVARTCLSQSQMSALSGEGTQLVFERLFLNAGLSPTVRSAEYGAGSQVDGECDLVFEDEENIVFVELKAKPLTRATMAAVPAAALLDLAGGMLAAQIQAQQHERILRTNGRIQFKNGHVLDLRARTIVRLSGTLLDLGSLQDRMLFWQLIGPLLQSTVHAEPGFGQTRQVDKINEILDAARAEARNLHLLGIPFDEQNLGCVSLNAGHLAVMLEGATSLADFIRRATHKVTRMTLNAATEYVLHKRAGLAR